ncbi:MAG: ATP-dependent zinc metalloprotease FtsH [bacterium]|nr:ATP-dependent zinc metalloprotease FtsH [bacterium]
MDPKKEIAKTNNRKKGKKEIKLKIKFNFRTVLLGLFLLLFILPAFVTALDMRGGEGKVELSQLFSDLKEGKVEKVSVENEKLLLTYTDGSVKYSIRESNESFTDLLDKVGIDPTTIQYTIVDQTLSKAFSDILGVVLPILLMLGVFYFIFKAQNKGAQDIFSFGRSKAKLFAKGKQSTTFADVAGVDEAKKELEEVVDFLKRPEKYRKLGARTPKGVLLFGPSGVGKTLLAKAVAGEANVPFFSMAGSEFMEMLVGIGASRVRDLFSQAKASAPSIIFIDEVDAIGRQRGRGLMGGHDEREQTLNQILVEMDGFTPNDSVLVMAATNRGDLLDPALLRPGRFDRRVTLDMPDKEGRGAILKIHAKGKKFAKAIKWGSVADRTVGFSGADIENMLNEAAILAARDNKQQIGEKDIEEAATKVKLGPAKRRLQSDEDRQLTAYHEAGHAIVTHILPKMDSVHRISIVARGMSLGHTLIPPAADRTHETKTRILQQIVAMLGGRAAEEIVFKEMTSGASNDIQRATQLARAMVIDFGMSPLGPINLGPQTELGEFGQPEWYEPAQVSQAMQEKADNEVKKIMDSSYTEALEIVKKHRKTMDKIVERLLIKETLDKDEFDKIVGKKSP